MLKSRRQRVAVYGLATTESALLLVRASPTSVQPARWWLPGGGLEFGETVEACLHREFQEETGLTITPRQLLKATTDVEHLEQRDESVHSVRLIYEVNVAAGHLRPEAGGATDDVAWIQRSALPSMDLVPFVRDLLAVLT